VSGDARDEGSRNGYAGLARWERVAAAFAGTLALLGGMLTVFRDGSEVASVTLIIVGAGFLHVGIQGTQLLRLSGGSANVELAARSQAAAEILKDVAATDPETAARIASAASLLGIDLFNAGYEESVLDVFASANMRILDMNLSRKSSWRGGVIGIFDNTFTTQIRTLYKIAGKVTVADLTPEEREIAKRTSKSPEGLGRLIVTNAEIDDAVRSLMGSFPGGLQVVQWNSRNDDHKVLSAFRSVGVYD